MLEYYTLALKRTTIHHHINILQLDINILQLDINTGLDYYKKPSCRSGNHAIAFTVSVAVLTFKIIQEQWF